MLQALACYFIKKETQAQVFSCEFCENSKNTFFTEHLRTNASLSNIYFKLLESIKISGNIHTKWVKLKTQNTENNPVISSHNALLS